MRIINKREYEKAKGIVKCYEEREQKIVQFKKELGERLQQFKKFTFKTKNNQITFAGYHNEDGMIVGIAICSDDDVFDKTIGKLVAVRKALGLKIDDIVQIVQQKCKSMSDVISSLEYMTFW